MRPGLGRISYWEIVIKNLRMTIENFTRYNFWNLPQKPALQTLKVVEILVDARFIKVIEMILIVCLLFY